MTPVVDIILPVYNEAHDLERGVRRLTNYLRAEFPLPARVVVVDNASTDGTYVVARRMAREVPGLSVLRLEHKGRGLALRHAWLASDAEVVAYMDIHLSTDLRALLPLVAPLLSGQGDVSIGSRLARGARVTRGPLREVLSRGYNRILRTALHARFSDAQCGFKALRAEVARELVPLVLDNEWFFDTELLVLAQRRGLRIHEVPVDWVDDPDSRVDIPSTVAADLRGVWRMYRARAEAPSGGGRRGLELAGRPELLAQEAPVGKEPVGVIARNVIRDLVHLRFQQ